jgi:hypothetical protein
MAGDMASLAAEITPYVSAAVGAYGGTVLANVRDDAADATVGLGRRLLQRVFGSRAGTEELPAPLQALAADPGDGDALAAVRLAIRQVLAADPMLAAGVRSMLAGAPKVSQRVHAGRDTYTAARDVTVIHQYAAGTGQPQQPGLTRPMPGVAGGPVAVGDIPQQPLTGDAAAVPAAAVGLMPAVSLGDGAGFSGEIHERYANDLVMAGLDVPDRWDLTALERLHNDCQHKASSQDATPDLRRAADLLEALYLAAGAMPVLRAVGGQVISTRKLRHLYLRHVGNRPDADTLEGMLILAAQVGISERRNKISDSGDQPAVPGALARFLLGIAGYWKGPGVVTLDNADLAGLAELVTGTGAHQLGLQREDAAEYLATKVRRRTWALIELDAPEHPDAAVLTWPTAVFVHAVPERGSTESQRFQCATASRAGVEEALRQAVDWLPEGDVYVDLCLPRNWLEAGVEYWDVVEMGGWYESLARNFQPRLRWSMHWRHPRLRDRLRERFGNVDWQADPEDLQEDVAGNTASFSEWLNARELPGTKHPPYLTACSPCTRDHDPLGTLLREGYGLLAWFSAQTPDGVRRDAVHAAVGLNKQKRREDLPDMLAAKLKAHRPAIIWSDPDGRADFPLPPPRQGSARRRYTQ